MPICTSEKVSLFMMAARMKSMYSLAAPCSVLLVATMMRPKSAYTTRVPSFLRPEMSFLNNWVMRL